MNLPKGFRYKSDWDTFCAVVESAQVLIQSKALFLLFGFEAGITFQELYSEEDYDSIGFSVDKRTFDTVLYDEILYLVNILININVMDADVSDELKAYLKQQNISSKESAEITDIYLKKLEYVKTHLLPSDGSRRSAFKMFTTSQKIQNLDWDICKYVFIDGSEQPYAQFKLSLLDHLPDIYSDEDTKPKKLQFVCDAQDIAYLIERLKQVQRRLEKL